MTRETKLGLVVAGSLMCLLGALIGKKLLFEETPVPDHSEQIVAKNDSAPSPSSEKKQVDSKVTEPNKHPFQNVNSGDILPVKANAENTASLDPKNGIKLPEPQPIGGKESIPIPLKQPQPTLEEILAEKAKKNGMGAFGKGPTLSIPPALPGKPPELPVSGGPEQVAQLNGKPMPQGPEIPPALPPEIPGAKKTSTDPKKEKPTKGNQEEPLPPSLPLPGSNGPVPVPPEPGKSNVPDIKDKSKIVGVPEIPTPPTPPVINEPSKGIPEFPPKQPGLELPKPPEPVKGTPPKIDIGVPPPPVEIKKKDPDPAEQQGLPQIKVKDFGQIPETPPLGANPAEPKNPENKIPDGPPIPPPGGNPPEGKKEVEKVPDLPMPPLGTDPPVKVDPMPIPMAPTPEPKKQTPGGPVVSEYEDEILKCQPDTLTFADISKKYYRSESYADALMQYNRNHPNGAASIKQVPPQLQVGQTVYIPPTIILETRYSQAIKNYKPLPQTPPIEIKSPIVAKTPETPPQGTQSYSPGNAGPSPIKITDKSVLQQTPQGPVYEVKTGNEMLLEIARQTLGDSRRWSEIYRLNPGINPAYPIPVGTRLKLPGTAKGNP